MLFSPCISMLQIALSADIGNCCFLCSCNGYQLILQNSVANLYVSNYKYYKQSHKLNLENIRNKISDLTYYNIFYSLYPFYICSIIQLTSLSTNCILFWAIIDVKMPNLSYSSEYIIYEKLNIYGTGKSKVQIAI